LTEGYGESEEALYSRVHLPHNPSMPQKGVPPQVLKRSAPVFAVALSGKEAVRADYSELHGHIQPRSPARH